MEELEEVVNNLKEQCASVRHPTPEMQPLRAAFLSSKLLTRRLKCHLHAQPLASMVRRDWSSFAHLRDAGSLPGLGTVTFLLALSILCL